MTLVCLYCGIDSDDKRAAKPCVSLKSPSPFHTFVVGSGAGASVPTQPAPDESDRLLRLAQRIGRALRDDDQITYPAACDLLSDVEDELLSIGNALLRRD